VTLGVDGFHLTFTEAIRPESLDKENFRVRSWFYKDTKKYGSPRHALRTHAVTAIEVDSSGKKVFIKLADMIHDRVYGIEAGDVISRTGLKPTRGSAYYTAHRLRR